MSVKDLRHYVELCEEGDKTVQERKQIILNQKQKIEEQLKEVKKHLELINMKLDRYDEIISKQTPSTASLPVSDKPLRPGDWGLERTRTPRLNTNIRVKRQNPR
jgi:hypothetical protein